MRWNLREVISIPGRGGDAAGQPGRARTWILSLASSQACVSFVPSECWEQPPAPLPAPGAILGTSPACGSQPGDAKGKRSTFGSWAWPFEKHLSKTCGDSCVTACVLSAAQAPVSRHSGGATPICPRVQGLRRVLRVVTRGPAHLRAAQSCVKIVCLSLPSTGGGSACVCPCEPSSLFFLPFWPRRRSCKFSALSKARLKKRP